MLRPTKSIGLYVQMLGRGCRTTNGKDDCLVLDFAGNTKRHGPVDEVAKRVKKKGKTVGEFPAKTCPSCKTILHAGTRVCTSCGHEFPPQEMGGPELARRADTAPILSTQVKAEWIDVTGIGYSVHAKPDKQISMCVEYQAGFVRHREWVCFEHSGYPRQKAVDWWLRRAPSMPVPVTVAEAMRHADDLPRPVAISVKPAGKYTEIVGVRFA